jgi:hypothetical protein
VTSKRPEENADIIIDRDEFTRIVDNLLKTPPKKRVDSKIGKKKSTGKIIPPRTEHPHQDQK